MAVCRLTKAIVEIVLEIGRDDDQWCREHRPGAHPARFAADSPLEEVGFEPPVPRLF